VRIALPIFFDTELDQLPCFCKAFKRNEQSVQTVMNGDFLFSENFLFNFAIPTPSIAGTGFPVQGFADFVAQCSQIVAEVAGFASGGPPTADAFFPSILATFLPAPPA
jgi:hypothetical protein